MRRRNSPEIITARIASSGAVVESDGQLEVYHESAGTYLVYAPSFLRVKTAVANPDVVASAFVACTGYVDHWFYVRCFVWNTANTPGDCPFNLIVVGVPR